MAILETGILLGVAGHLFYKLIEVTYKALKNILIIVEAAINKHHAKIKINLFKVLTTIGIIAADIYVLYVLMHIRRGF